MDGEILRAIVPAITSIGWIIGHRVAERNALGDISELTSTTIAILRHNSECIWCGTAKKESGNCKACGGPAK